MSDASANLELPYILASQAQKEVTHNEALQRLDAAVQAAVLDRDLAAPPAGPADGDRYLVAAGATGAWIGQEGRLAAWYGGWRFLAPRAGWTVWVADEGLAVRYDGAAWTPIDHDGLPGVTGGAPGERWHLAAAEVAKLAGIEAGAQVNSVTSVQGRTGAVSVTRGDLGLDGTDKPSFANLGLAVLSARLANATVKAVLLYDTAKDSDGGAWRHRCRRTSWYNESLGTATRGTTRDFPALALIVATQSGTTIYDATDPDLPMWMVFQGGTFRMNYSANAGTMCLAARDGLLLIGFGTSGSLGVTEIHFLLDEGRYNQGNAIQKRDSWAGLANRNDTGTAWVANAPLFITGAVSQDTRGIAIHVAAEAPLDRRTGLPRPTVALATAGGRSVVLPDGRVCNSLTTAAQDWVGFDADGALYGVQNGNAGLHRIARTWYQAGGFDYDTIYYGTVPALPNPNVARAAAAVPGGVAVGGSAGVQFVCWPVGSKARGMVAYVGRTHATGWLPGDIRGCWLANSKTADRSVKGNALTETGLLSEAAVAAGAELKGYSGFSAANYLSLAHDADLDFGDGDFAVLFWIRMSANAPAETVFERDSSPTAQRITVGVTAAGMLQFATDDGTDAVTSTGPVIDDGVWRHVACVMRGSRQELWVDGTRCDSDDATAVGSLSNPAAVLRIGLDVAGSAPLVSGALALLRVTAFAPTPDQIARIHADERPLFHENARCLLGGAVDQVDAVAADPDSGRVYFATADGTSVFEALRRVDFLDAAANANLTSGVHKAVSAVRGGYAIGSAAEAVAWLPASNLREELVASPAGVPPVPAFRAATADATPADIAKWPLAEGRTVLVEAVVEAREDVDSPTERAGYVRRAVFHRDIGGNVTLAGSASGMDLHETTAGMDCTLHADTAAQTIDVNVTGVAGKTLVWAARLTATEIAG